MPTTDRRPRLTPAIADVRRAVRESLAVVAASALPVEAPAPTDTTTPDARPAAHVLVALSGGPDSLALAAAVAFEAPAAGLRAGAIVVDHALQSGSAEVAARAADQARALGLAPVLVTRLALAAEVAPDSGVPTAAGAGGPEARARAGRYAAIDRALADTGALAVLLGHTLDDQAETVLLGLARGAGATSLSGMAAVTPPPGADDPHEARDPGALAAGSRIRPLLRIRRTTTLQFCADSGLDPWHDPHNLSDDFARVRVRGTVLPVLEAELGPGIAEALARTADQLREDDETLHAMAIETIEDLVEHAEAGIAVSVGALEANPPALRHRIIRYVAASEFGVSLSRAQTLAVAALVTDWHGQKGVDLPGIRVVRQGSRLEFTGAAPHRAEG
ncbi:tRNA lysidine(34) synthetase TilS [Herbiconiux moechotypicola]|uniref:tRNA(Ile)-lysidine synthase n=1 Tax=Herbiconiux moechotypicola TaxID=637393 RepID=A0ABN3E4P5_9MICO|nr:tRNA lysidine(34) synthetase TilS [Herbiconiux moechotypicola]MCS5731620.1 tRNA lysidine(34) synthetase TilS [Herbiconiux moechotypicola]